MCNMPNNFDFNLEYYIKALQQQNQQQTSTQGDNLQNNECIYQKQYEFKQGGVQEDFVLHKGPKGLCILKPKEIQNQDSTYILQQEVTSLQQQIKEAQKLKRQLQEEILGYKQTLGQPGVQQLEQDLNVKSLQQEKQQRLNESILTIFSNNLHQIPVEQVKKLSQSEFNYLYLSFISKLSVLIGEYEQSQNMEIDTKLNQEFEKYALLWVQILKFNIDLFREVKVLTKDIMHSASEYIQDDQLVQSANKIMELAEFSKSQREALHGFQQEHIDESNRSINDIYVAAKIDMYNIRQQEKLIAAPFIVFEILLKDVMESFMDLHVYHQFTDIIKQEVLVKDSNSFYYAQPVGHPKLLTIEAERGRFRDPEKNYDDQLYQMYSKFNSALKIS